ncbi:MAG TPA: flavin reductase family protein [Clostridiales bacterium]|nr:flavin reductase family protein [Clostridiales bacterium]
MLKEFDLKTLNKNPFDLIGKQWMLISAGDNKKHNMMTASWGTLGVLWNKNIAIIFVRPTRYTFEFLEKHDHFSLNFPIDSKVHDICGSRSGREIDKTKACNLTPVYSDGTVYFGESEMVIICKKIYQTNIDPDMFLDSEIQKHYPLKDYHKVYIGEIIKAYKKS